MGKRKEIIPISHDDRVFFESFYQDHKRFMYYTAKKYARSNLECEDIVQEAIIRLLKNISVLREIDGCKIQQYIVLTIKASFIDMERKRHHEEPVNLDDETLEALFKADLIDAEEIPDVEAKLEVEKIRSEMGFREWILLEGKYILGYTHEELGTLIGVAPNSVRMIPCRAKEKARSILSSGRRRGGKNDEG